MKISGNSGEYKVQTSVTDNKTQINAANNRIKILDSQLDRIRKRKETSMASQNASVNQMDKIKKEIAGLEKKITELQKNNATNNKVKFERQSSKLNIDEKDLSEMLENREDKSLTKLGVEYVYTHKVNDFYEINELFSDSSNLEQRLAKDYETRYKKIKEAVHENPNLKSMEKELINELDNIYNEVLDYQAMFFANAYTYLAKNSNEVKRNVSEEFDVEYKPLEELNALEKKEVKNDYKNFFKNITNQIKNGKSPDDIKGINLSSNKRIKTYEDIRGIHKASQKMFSFYLDIAQTRMRSFARGSSLDEKVTEFNELYIKFKTNTFNKTSQSVKKVVNTAFDFEALFSLVQSRLKNK